MTFIFEQQHKLLANYLYHIKVDGGYYATNDERLFEHYTKLIGGMV